MSKLLSVILAAAFAAVTITPVAFAADKEETKDVKKDTKKKDTKKKDATTKDETKKDETKKDK